MTLNDIREKIFSAISASWASTDIAIPNYPFNPPKGSAWIRPTIKIPSTVVGELGENGVGLRDGLLMISVFVPPNTGTKLGSRYADKLETLFRRKDLDDLWFDEPTSSPVGDDPNGYYHILMICDFHCWVGET